MNYEETINGIIDIWETDTLHLSYTDIEHPAFILVQMINPSISIPIILKRMEKEMTLFFSILWHIVPEEDRPIVPEELRGKIQKLTDLWIQWGKERKYV